jgi:hypothetical protein
VNQCDKPAVHPERIHLHFAKQCQSPQVPLRLLGQRRIVRLALPQQYLALDHRGTRLEAETVGEPEDPRVFDFLRRENVLGNDRDGVHDG